MKRSIKLFAILFVASLISSCAEEDFTIEETDYLIFGHFYGLCGGETCVETYKLTDTQLFEDLADDYSKVQPFDFTELGTADFDAVKDISTFLPSDLLNEADQTFGCPDCVDQGGIYIEYHKDGTTQKWRFDQSKDAIPSYLHDFHDKVNEKIALINN